MERNSYYSVLILIFITHALTHTQAHDHTAIAITILEISRKLTAILLRMRRIRPIKLRSFGEYRETILGNGAIIIYRLLSHVPIS